MLRHLLHINLHFNFKDSLKIQENPNDKCLSMYLIMSNSSKQDLDFILNLTHKIIRALPYSERINHIKFKVENESILQGLFFPDMPRS